MVVRPSFLGLIASGVLILVALIALLLNADKVRADQVVILILLFSIAISIHSVQHLFEEIYFRFNPLGGQWVPLDTPVGPGMGPGMGPGAFRCPCGPRCACAAK